MTKLVLALHTDVRERLLASPIREALTAAGATAVQVNVDDADVAPAMRFGPGDPITAVVSVWTDSEPGAGLDNLVAAAAEAVGESDLHAWRVTEKVRLDPLPVADGERADVLAQVALLRRPESMSPEDYRHRWLVQHTPVAIRTQNTSAYVQNVVEEGLTPTTPEVAAIVEEHFPMAGMTDPHAFYGSRGDDAELDRRIRELMTSVNRFGAAEGLDLVPTSRYVWRLLG